MVVASGDGLLIRMTKKTHPGIPNGLTIGIMYGVTEQAIHDELKGLGVLEGAIIKKDPRL